MNDQSVDQSNYIHDKICDVADRSERKGSAALREFALMCGLRSALNDLAAHHNGIANLAIHCGCGMSADQSLFGMMGHFGSVVFSRISQLTLKL